MLGCEDLHLSPILPGIDLGPPLLPGNGPRSWAPGPPPRLGCPPPPTPRPGLSSNSNASCGPHCLLDTASPMGPGTVMTIRVPKFFVVLFKCGPPGLQAHSCPPSPVPKRTEGGRRGETGLLGEGCSLQLLHSPRRLRTASHLSVSAPVDPLPGRLSSTASWDWDPDGLGPEGTP